MEIANKRALVLGGAFGFATAEQLAAAGVQVILVLPWLIA
jgi:NAD(P)-dependent dehydrogenase (short-subunit alcohol dehydrogenase family)